MDIRSQQQQQPEPFCLIHYYTTRACRIDPSQVVEVIRNGDASNEEDSDRQESESKQQLPYMQKLFSEAFLELQKEIGEESARSFRETSSDPLSILSSIHSRKSTPSLSMAAKGRRKKSGTSTVK